MTISPTYRIMCCLLAALLLFTFVSRPLEVSATGLEAAAAGFVGIAPEVAIPIILVLLGISVVGKNWDRICNWVEDNFDQFTTWINDETVIPAYNYNGQLYIEQSVIDGVADLVAEFNSFTYDDAWTMGQQFTYMYNIALSNSAYDMVVWSNTAPYIGTSQNEIMCPAPCVVYMLTTSQHIYDYRDYNDYKLYPNYVVPCSISNVTVKDIYVTEVSSVTSPVVDATTITVNTPDDEKEKVIPIAPSSSTPYEDSHTLVEVLPNTGTGTESGVTSIDLSGVISWLKSIWQAISNLAAQITSPIVSALTSVKSAITTGVTTITDAITKTIADIIEWLKSMGATLADILEWIKTLPASIAQAISTVITDVFVPSADFISEKVDAITSRFAWITPLVDIAQGLSVDLSSSTPPIVYVHLEDSESEYIKGGTVKFIDMSWYARYKPYGDVILSGFLWALFAWRMYLKIPGIINGVGGSVGHIASSGGYRRKEDGE